MIFEDFALTDYVAWLGSAGALAIVGNIVIQWLKGRSLVESAEIEQAGGLRASTDEIALKLLDAADSRISHWQSENLRLTVRLAKVESELIEARQAIDLLRSIMEATTCEEKALVERRAKVFLASLSYISDDRP